VRGKVHTLLSGDDAKRQDDDRKVQVEPYSPALLTREVQVHKAVMEGLNKIMGRRVAQTESVAQCSSRKGQQLDTDAKRKRA